ncbi:hypothetical protein CHH28_16800 [Bacterioplanes sanyensis]|uniref:Beta-lactamase n=1 Tax=Bacterioplanes sanyensis TaxID=1249553 RepID=A0A222FNZ2_9GAMM|nr:class A beta-lactamase [Bacterioplanes sanyensis]ASP40234.1 hypothetical protein CHH28_16800 [Bacterioplanes sanyensis]
MHRTLAVWVCCLLFNVEVLAQEVLAQKTLVKENKQQEILTEQAFSSRAQSALTQQVQTVEASIGARIGVAVLAPDGRRGWHYQGDQRFALTSTFKTLLCAQLLNREGAANTMITMRQQDLVSYAPVMKTHIGETLSAAQLCGITLASSDNSAANLVLNALGGPMALTEFLRQHGDTTTRLDRMETELNSAIPGDVRDTTTPVAMVRTLRHLLVEQGLSSSAQQQLRQWMINNQVADGLLRSVLPARWQIADRSGAGGHGARAITALVWPVGEAQQPWVLAIYIAETDAEFAQRNAAIVAIGEAVFSIMTGK